MTRSGFTELLGEQIPRLRRYARALAGDLETADDLVQDCLERAWDRRHQWRADSDLRAWLFAILYSQFVNHLRRRRYITSGIPLDERVHDTGTSAGDGIGQVELNSALQRLSVEHRAVLLLVCLEGFSYEDTATTLGIPVGTVMSRLHRAREGLRRLLHEETGVRLRRVK